MSLPWYVSGPLLGLVIPALLLAGGKAFGLSANLRHLCAAAPLPAKPAFFRYDWRTTGLWNLVFLLGIVLGGLAVAALGLVPDVGMRISEATQADLRALGVTEVAGVAPASLFSWKALATPVGFAMVVGGGFLVGFGARYAGGCTSGHALSGLSNLQAPSLVAVVGFFAGGLVATHVLLPLLFR